MSRDVRIVWVWNAMLAAAVLLAPSLSRAEGPPGAATPAAAAPTAGAPHAAAAAQRPTIPEFPQGPITESTSVKGKIDAKLKGVWLLVANAELVPGKFKTFPQFFKIGEDKNGPTFQLLDVRPPDDVQQTLKMSSNRTLQAWQPDDATLKELQKTWSTLPPAKTKAIAEFLYDKIHYQLIGPDQAKEMLASADEALGKVIKDSKFLIVIEEEYKPRDLGPDSRMAQMITRATTYGVKSIDKDTLKGTMALDFVAAGAGSPIPYQFSGPFVMYRLAP